MKKYFLQLKFFIVLLMVNFFHVTRPFFICDTEKMTNNNEKLYQQCSEAEKILFSFFKNHDIYEKYVDTYEKLKNTHEFSHGDNLSILRNDFCINQVYFNADTKQKEALFFTDLSFLEIITLYRIYREVYYFLQHTSIYDFVIFFENAHEFLNNPMDFHETINVLDDSYISYTLYLFYHKFFSTIWTSEEKRNKRKFLSKILKIKDNLKQNSTILSAIEINISLWEDVFQTMQENQCSLEEKQSFFTLGKMLTSINSSLEEE